MSASWRANPIDHKWRKLRLLILERDKWQCRIKGPKCTTTATQVDHIHGRGVSEDPKDLRAACAPCNWSTRPPKDPHPEPRTRW